MALRMKGLRMKARVAPTRRMVCMVKRRAKRLSLTVLPMSTTERKSISAMNTPSTSDIRDRLAVRASTSDCLLSTSSTPGTACSTVLTTARLSAETPAAPDIVWTSADPGIAAVDEDILAFPEGYDTMVGERGVTLSGGQKQRVAMARTLLMDCPIVVFDDSMSAVDMETDAQIREALRENTSGTTVIMISHRINTLMLSDQILVVDGGRIAQSGTHEELLQQEGLYRRVYDLQSGAHDPEEGGEDA